MVVKASIKNLYELLVVLKPTLSEKDLDGAINQVQDSIKNFGGNIVKSDELIRRRFTHTMKGFKEGFYISMIFNSPPELPNTLKRTLAVSDDVLRHVILKIENN